MFAPDYIEAPEPGPELALEPARSIPGIPPRRKQYQKGRAWGFWVSHPPYPLYFLTSICPTLPLFSRKDFQLISSKLSPPLFF